MHDRRQRSRSDAHAAVEVLDAASVTLPARLADQVVEGRGGEERVELESELMERREVMELALALVQAHTAPIDWAVAPRTRHLDEGQRAPPCPTRDLQRR